MERASLYRIPHCCWSANAREQVLCQVGPEPAAGLPGLSPILPAPSQSYPQIGRVAVEMWKKEKCAKSAKLFGWGPCHARGSALVSPLRRARSATRVKQIPRAVAGRRKSPGSVDESETGSANDLAQRSLRVPRRQIVFLVPAGGRARWPTGCGNVEKRKSCKLRRSCFSASCNPPPAALLSPLRRARSATRVKQIPRAVAGRRKSPGSVDESETGSANELAQRGFRVPRRQFVFVDRNGVPAPAAGL